MSRNWNIITEAELHDQIEVELGKRLVAVLDKLAAGDPVEGTVKQHDWDNRVYRWSPIPPEGTDAYNFAIARAKNSVVETAWLGVRVVYTHINGRFTVIAFGSKTQLGPKADAIIYGNAKKRCQKYLK